MQPNTLDFTYEAGTDEMVHPDPVIAQRFVEIAISNCAFGCKIYADPHSSVRVLSHNSIYGCTKTHARIQSKE